MPLMNEFLVPGNNGIIQWSDNFGKLEITWGDVEVLNIPGFDKNNTYVSEYSVVYGENIPSV